MATVGTSYLGLIDLFKRQDPTGQIAAIIELLVQTNKILEDAPAMECNDGTSHLTTTRVGYPTPTWRRLYQGIQPTKSTTAQVRDATGMLEAWSEVDAKLVALSNNPAAFRLSEAVAFLEGMNNEMASTIFYGNKEADPEKFMGLAPRFDVRSATADTIGNQIIHGGGGGADNTSVWFIVWGESTCHLLYPKGTVGGLQRQDLGEETKTVHTDGTVFRVMREKFNWDVGLSVRDWRYVVRIANIDVSDLRAGSVDILGLFRQAYWRLKQREIPNGRAAIYCNADVMESLDAASTGSGPTASAPTLVRLTPENVHGEPVMYYRNMPVRQCDALLNNETVVS